MSSHRAAPPLPEHPSVYPGALELIGDTPLYLLRRVGSARPRARIYAKAEQMNPGGSLKDRICIAIIEDAERRGVLAPGGIVVEATSGNTGIGLALVCAKKGYQCVLTMPASMSLERRQLLEAYGAEVIFTEPERQLEGAVARAAEVARERPGAFLTKQFDNPANPRAHEETTAREILVALGDERLDAFVTGVGTGGTVSGVGRVLRRERPGARIVGVEPASSATIARGERGPTKIQGLAAGFVPKNYDPDAVHELVTVTDAEAFAMKDELARREGLLVGPSSGAAVHAAVAVAERLATDAVVVTVLADTGERYFSLEEQRRDRVAQSA